MNHKCTLCGEGFFTEDERNFHETYVRHCPTCQESSAGGEKWTPTNWGRECRLCVAESAFSAAAEREGESTLWH